MTANGATAVGITSVSVTAVTAYILSLYDKVFKGQKKIPSSRYSLQFQR